MSLIIVHCHHADPFIRAGSKILSVKKGSIYSRIVSDFDCGRGFIGTADNSFKNIRGKPVNRDSLAECQ